MLEHLYYGSRRPLCAYSRKSSVSASSLTITQMALRKDGRNKDDLFSKIGPLIKEIRPSLIVCQESQLLTITEILFSSLCNVSPSLRLLLQQQANQFVNTS